MYLKENTPKAILLIIIGMSVFALQDTLIKLISHETNIFLIYACRCLFGILILIIFLLFVKKPIIIKTNYPFLTILRCFLFFVGFSLYYFSLSKLSLAVAVTLFFVSPFFVTILSMLILKESIGIRRWGALVIGFLGVFLVMNPQIDNFNFYTLFPMICAFCYALTMIIQKKTSEKDNLYSQTFHIYISALLFVIIIGIFTANGQYFTPNNHSFEFLLRPWIISNSMIMFSLFLIGLFGVIGFLCVFESYRIGSPASVAPFEYILIIWAILISWIIWDEILSIKSYIGIFLIIFAGLYTFFRENIKNREVTINKPLR